jgi:hypothetical protein
MPKFIDGDRVQHRRAKMLGVGTVLCIENRPDDHVPGWWVTVRFDQTGPTIKSEITEEFHEDVLELSVLDQIVGKTS